MGSFNIMETTVSLVHAAMKAGEVTSRALVDSYLRRIEAYEKKGPSLHSIISVNPKACDEADYLDRKLAETGELQGPLHGIPVMLKDNVNTIFLLKAMPDMKKCCDICKTICTRISYLRHIL
jgi:amidase